MKTGDSDCNPIHAVNEYRLKELREGLSSYRRAQASYIVASWGIDAAEAWKRGLRDDRRQDPGPRDPDDWPI